MVLRATWRADRSRHGSPWIVAALSVLLGATDAAATNRAGDDEEANPIEEVGPLRIPRGGREQVRGWRPADGSIFVAWAPGIEDPDRTHRDALEAFERATFPPGSRHSTLVDVPPEPWMAKLVRPDLPVRWNNKTVEYLRYFRDEPRGQVLIRAWMARAGRYESHLRKILREVGVPQDLVFVALAESGFDPRVRSRVGAAGLWQFMEGTGSVYGLARDYWIDERLDIEKSTYAAALYLKDLRARFGSWELALAAYNAGYGLVMTSIARHNTNNFWALAEIESGLPYATNNYIPKIIAAALVGHNRQTFACDDGSIDVLPPVDWVKVQVSQSTALAKIAAMIDEDESLIAELNAELIRGRTPPRRGSYAVRIPRHALPRWKDRKDALRAAWDEESQVIVREGESLDAIAMRYGVSERALRRLNGVRDAGEVQWGVTLVVPKEKPTSQPQATKPAPDAELPILAAVPHLEPGSGHRLLFLTITRATTPKTLSTAFGVRWEEIVRWNDLDPHARLQAGQVVQIVVPKDFDPDQARVDVHEPDEVQRVVRGSREHIEAELERRDLVRRGYEVRKGDTLLRIGRRFGLTVGDLTRINGISRRDPQPGELLVVYVPRHKVRSTVPAPPPPPVYASAESPPASSLPSSSNSTRTSRQRRTATSRRRPPSTPSTARRPGSD